MKKLISSFLIFFSLSFYSSGDELKISRDDYLKLIIGNYIHGFNQFDTTLVVMNNSVSIRIYYKNEKNLDDVQKLTERFKNQIPHILERYHWTTTTNVIVSTYQER
jgi:hypothetical protein